MIQYEEALVARVRTKNPLVKTIAYNSRTFILYHQKLITKYAESYLNIVLNCSSE